MADRMMVNYLHFMESSFTCVVVDNFRIILSQEGLTVDRMADDISDDDDSLCVVEVDKEEDQDI